MFPSWLTFGVALTLVALWVLVYRRYWRKVSGRDDRYSPEPILSREQVHLLDYLRDTFPHQVVLPNMLLKDMLSVRRAANPQRAWERLRRQKVDFVVCGADGRPKFAFDVEQHHLSNAQATAHQVQMKNRILKTAGVRFLLLKDGIHRMPSPAEFRQQLQLAALPPSKPKAAGTPASVHQQLESRFSAFDSLHPTTGFRESEVMGMTGLMGLEAGGTDHAARQRAPSQRARLH